MDRSNTRELGETGLGLALSRKLARALDRDKELFESKVEVGDQNSSHGLKVLHDSEFKTNPFDGIKILLVDDSADNRIALTNTC